MRKSAAGFEDGADPVVTFVVAADAVEDVEDIGEVEEEEEEEVISYFPSK